MPQVVGDGGQAVRHHPESHDADDDADQDVDVSMVETGDELAC